MTGAPRRRGRPPRLGALEHRRRNETQQFRHLVKRVQGRRGDAPKIRPLSPAERRAYEQVRRDQDAHVIALDLTEARELTNEEIADHPRMRRVLGKQVSPARIAQLKKNPAGLDRVVRHVEEFKRKYCGPRTLGDLKPQTMRAVWNAAAPDLASILMDDSAGTVEMPEWKLSLPDQIKPMERMLSVPGAMKRLNCSKESLAPFLYRLKPGGPSKVPESIVKGLQAQGGLRGARHVLPEVSNEGQLPAVTRELRRCRDAMIKTLWEKEEFRERFGPLVLQERNRGVQDVAKRFGLSLRQVLRILRQNRRPTR